MISYMQSIIKQANEATPEKEILEILVKNMGKYYPERSHLTVHASDVTKDTFCPRRILLMDAFNMKVKDQYIAAALRATFDVGKMTAKLMVEEWGGQAVLGNWKCLTCKAKKMFSRKPKDGCIGAGNCNWEYEETGFFSPEIAVSGSLDMLFDVGLPKYKIVEIKIMNATDFEKLVAPLAEHRLRTRLYMWLVENSESPLKFKLDLQTAKVIYISRGFGKKNGGAGQILPFKEFDVERDDESIEPYINRGRVVRHCREKNEIPIHKVCDTPTCQTAKGCEVKDKCWSGQIP